MAEWSPEEDGKLLRAWLQEGRKVLDIAMELEKSRSATHRRISHLGVKGEQGNVSLYQKITGGPEEPALKPVQIKLPPKPRRYFSSADSVSVVWGDVHFPFHDRKAVEVLYKITDLVQPTELFCIGDVYDFWQLSDHRPPEHTKMDPWQIDLQETVELGSEHLGQMLRISNPKDAYFLHGNHEDRWSRLLSAIRDNRRMMHMMGLPGVSDALQLDKILGLDELGYKTLSYIQDDLLVIRDRLVVEHGYSVSKWAGRARIDHYGKSAIFGHTHRIQNYTKRDLNGTIAGWSVGCLCNLDQHYVRYPDWAQGFAVIVWKKLEDGWMFNVEQVRIHDGTAVFRDKVVKA